MISRDVLNIHDSNVRLSVLDVHTRLRMSIRCATHELSYINATSAKLVCMYTSINIVSLCISSCFSLEMAGDRCVQSPKTLTGRGVLQTYPLSLALYVAC